MMFVINSIQDLWKAIPKSHRKDEVVGQVDGGLKSEFSPRSKKASNIRRGTINVVVI